MRPVDARELTDNSSFRRMAVLLGLERLQGVWGARCRH